MAGKVTGYASPVANPRVEKPIIVVNTSSAVDLRSYGLVEKFSTMPDENPRQVVHGNTNIKPVL